MAAGPASDDTTGGALNDRQRAFAVEYAALLNATKAAIAAGYSQRTAKQMGAKLKAHPAVRAEIDRLLAERKISGEEVIARLEQQATADFGDCLAVKEYEITRGRGKAAKTEKIRRVEIDLEQVMKLGLTHLIRKVRTDAKSGQIVAVEFYDVQRALALLGRHHGVLGNVDERDNDEFGEGDEVDGGIGDDEIRAEAALNGI